MEGPTKIAAKDLPRQRLSPAESCQQLSAELVSCRFQRYSIYAASLVHFANYNTDVDSMN